MADIARHVGVRYQFAYNVLHRDGAFTDMPSNVAPRTGGSVRGPKTAVFPAKPTLTVAGLEQGGFSRVSCWVLSKDKVLAITEILPAGRGVYAFVIDGIAVYVGLATMGVARRLHFYARPGVTQTTSIRVGKLLKAHLLTAPHVDIYVAHPTNFEVLGLPFSGDAGLELGLIERFNLPWNLRGAGKANEE